MTAGPLRILFQHSVNDFSHSAVVRGGFCIAEAIFQRGDRVCHGKRMPDLKEHGKIVFFVSAGKTIFDPYPEPVAKK